MVQMPSLDSKVFYFRQGHAEHAQAGVDFEASLRIPALVLCRVVAVKFLANPKIDEVFAKIKLIPLRNFELDDANGDENTHGSENSEKPASFANTLTHSMLMVEASLFRNTVRRPYSEERKREDKKKEGEREETKD
ncbi:hypothetical protein K1719_018560 [Acacia pycnantha]|nr:hypothetical protein K1719_018560 [Acacia pycnantha]